MPCQATSVICSVVITSVPTLPSHPTTAGSQFGTDVSGKLTTLAIPSTYQNFCFGRNEVIGLANFTVSVNRIIVYNESLKICQRNDVEEIDASDTNFVCFLI